MSLDIVVLRLRAERLELLLEPRQQPPFAAAWQVPTLAIEAKQDNDLEATRDRLLSEWGLCHCYSEQVGTVGSATRDPRGWSAAVVYLCLVAPNAEPCRGQWQALASLPSLPLAFDHPQLIAKALERLRIKSRYSTLPMQLLATEFTLSEVQHAFEIILQTPMNTAAFRKRLLRAEILQDTGSKRTGKQRPAIVYRATNADCVLFDQVMNGAES
ncbi:MAG: NUDIX hydrolase [Aeromonas sp.]